MNNFTRELEVATQAVQGAALLAKTLQQSLSKDATTKKADHSEVTIGDFAIQALLTSVLHSTFPKDQFLAEESADELKKNALLREKVWGLTSSHETKQLFKSLKGPDGESVALPSSEDEMLQLIDMGGKHQDSATGRVWVMDPIDGTATFMRGHQFAINCVLLVDGKEQVAIIGCPNIELNASKMSEDIISDQGCIVTAVRGQGTWVRPISTTGELSSATRLPRYGDNAGQSDLRWTDDANATSTIKSWHKLVAAQLRIPWPGLDFHSSIVKYAGMGLGHGNVCLRIFKHKSYHSNVWDHAGGLLIFEEVGGQATDLEGKPIDLSRGRKMSANFGLVCAPRSVHPVVLRAVQQIVNDNGGIH